MRVGFYLGHPAQFHFFKYTILRLQNDGHLVVVLLKTKDVLEDLVRQSGIPYINIQKEMRKNSVFSIAMASFERTFRVYRIARKYQLNMLLGTDASVAQAGKLLHIPAFTTTEDDVEIVMRLAKLTYPFTTNILTPEPCRVGKWEKKKIGYRGYMKLAYLHPNEFTPDIAVVRQYITAEKYCLIRLAKLSAYHDVNIKGLNVDLVLRLIEKAEGCGYKVYISSEGELDNSLRSYQLQIKTSDIHHIMSFASLIVSDSQSMSVEAAMLGVPSLRFSDFSGRISVLEELEHKYQLTFGIKTSEKEKLLEKFTELLSEPELKELYQSRRQKMLHDKIDVTAFLVWWIEKYPESAAQWAANPEIQNKFK